MCIIESVGYSNIPTAESNRLKPELLEEARHKIVEDLGKPMEVIPWHDVAIDVTEIPKLGMNTWQEEYVNTPRSR